MLVELVVENYAVVERLRVRFHPGFNVLTGETGSGKSILVDALGLLFGGRASAEAVRTGAERARVSGIFELPEQAELEKLLAEAGIETEDDLLVEREILASGKSRAFVGSRPVTAALLREIAPFLGDIHGQHEQQRLFSADAQRDMLDSFAGADTSQTARIHADWRRCTAQLDEITAREQEQLRLADLWSFQLNEIESAALTPGEDAKLEAERNILRNTEKLAEAASAAYDALYDSPSSALAQLRTAMKKTQDLARIDPSLAAMPDSLRAAESLLDDAARDLGHYASKLESDPTRLDDIESRLAAIDKLKRKYGATLAEVLAFLADVRAKMSIVETANERRAEIEARRAKLADQFREAAARLTRQRNAAARKLQTKLESELADLAMARAVFRIAVTPAEWAAHGADAVGFEISANAGEEPKPLDKVASGGELSRIALALKTAIATAQSGRTMVFDEVDAGIGGAAAEAVGRRLKGLADVSQVLCVTHQAQIAGFADHHFRVEKRESKGRTTTALEELLGEERTREVSRMLSGRLTPEALRHAEQLILQK